MTNCNLKKTKLVAMCLIINILLTACTTTNIEKNLTSESTLKYIESLNEYYNESLGGYIEILDKDAYLSDGLYFTYYSMEILKKIDSKTFEKCAPDIKRWHESISIEDILSDDNYDRLDDIYYYLKLSNVLNLSTNNEKCNDLFDFLVSIQQPEGHFYKSKTHTLEELSISERAIDSRVILSTLNSIELLSETNDVNINLLNKWLNELVNNIKEENDSIVKLNYLHAYVKAHDLLDLEISNEINSMASLLIEDINSYISSTSDIYLISLIYELDLYINNGENSKLYKSITNTILNSNSTAENFHVTIYYNIFKILDANISDTENIVQSILERKVPNSFFVGDIYNTIDIVATNYAFKTLDILGYSYDPTQCINFFSKNINEKSVIEKINYIDIASRFNLESSNYNNLLNSLFEEAINVDFAGESNFNNYSLISSIIKLSKNTSIEVPTDLSKKLVLYASSDRGSDKSFDINTFLYNCTDLIVLRNLSGSNEAIESKEKIIIDSINEHYNNMDDTFKNVFLYFGILALEENKTAIDSLDFNEKELKKELENNKLDGLYSISQGVYPNMENQYIINLLLSKL